MQNLKLIQNKIYKIKYTINDTEYFSFCTFTGDHYFLDVITNKLFDIKDITYIDHTKIDHKIIKYFTKLYKKENNISIFKSSTVYDLNLQLYVNVLRFFDLKDQDLIQNNKEKYLKDNNLVSLVTQFEAQNGYLKFVIVYNVVGQKIWYGNKSDQFILTNEHVVSGSTSYNIIFYDGKQIPAKISSISIK